MSGAKEGKPVRSDQDDLNLFKKIKEKLLIVSHTKLTIKFKANHF